MVGTVTNAEGKMIYLEKTALDAMTKHAESTTDECCGFLIGYELHEDRTITQVIYSANLASAKHNRYEIGPNDFMRAEEVAEEQKQQLLGVYHSHPNQPALPSEQDRVAALPNFSYIILSVLNGHVAAVRCWRLNANRQFEEENIIRPITQSNK